MSAKGGSGNFPINVIASAQGLDQVTSQLTRFADMLKAAGSTMQQQISQMNSLGAAFTKFGQSSTGLNSSITQTSNTLKQLGPAATQAGSSLQQTQTKMTQFMDSTKQTGTAVTQAGNQIKTLGPAAAAAGSGVQAAQGKLTQFSEAAKMTGTSSTQAGSQVKTLGPSFQAAGSAATAANGQLTTLSTGLKAVGTTVQTTGTEFRTLGPSIQTAGANMATATTEANALGTALQKEAQFSANAITNTTRYASVLQEAGMATADLAGKQDLSNMSMNKGTGYNKSMTDSIIHGTKEISSMGMGFMMLSNTMNDNGLVMENIAMQNEKVKEAQARVNETTAQYGKDSFQARQATSALAQAQRGLQFETREANAQQHNMLFMQAMIASEILSAVIPALLKYQDSITKAKDLFAALQSGISKAPAAFDKLGSSLQSLANISNLLPDRFNKTKAAATTLETAVTSGTGKAGIFSGALNALGGALQAGSKDLSATGNAARVAESGLVAGSTAGRGLIGVLGPLAIAAAAGGIAIAAYATNAWGFRDAVNGVGKAIGDAVPILAPFLEGIMGIAGALGLTGETAEQTKQHFTNMTAGFQNMGTLWNDTVANMQGSNNLLVKSMGDTAAVLGVDMTKAFGDLRNQIGLSITAFNQFIDALGKGDYETATRLIEQAFAAIPGIIGTIMVDVGTVIYDALVGIGNTVGPIILGIGNVMGKQLMSGLQSSWSTITNLVNTYVVQPIQNAINGIASGIQNIAGQVWTALGLEGVFPTVSRWISAIAQTISNLGAFITSAAQGVWTAMGLEGLFPLVSGVIDTIAKGLSGIGESVSSILTAVWNKWGLGTIYSSYVQPLITQVSQGLSNVYSTIASVVTQVWTKWGLGDLYNKYVSPLISIITNGLNTIANYVGEVANAIWSKWMLPNLMNFIDDLMRRAGAMITSISNWVKPAVDFVWQKLGLQDMVTRAQTLGGQIIDAIVTGINNGLGKVQDALNKAGASIGGAVGGVVSQLTPGSSGANPQVGSNAELDRQKALDAETKKNQQAAQSGTKTTPGPIVPSGVTSSVGIPKQGPASPTSTPGVAPAQQQQQKPQVVPQKQQPAQNLFNTNIPGAQGAAGASSSLTAALAGVSKGFSTIPPQAQASGKAISDYAASAKNGAAASEQAARTAKMVEQNLGFMGTSAKKLGGDLEGLKGEIIGNSLALNTASTLQDIYTAGQYEQVTALQELQGANVKASGALSVYNDQIATGQTQAAEYTAGVLEQGKSLNDLIATTAHSQGVNAEYTRQLTTAKGINAEVNQGYVAQQGALNDLVAQTYQTMGGNAAYAQQLANGSMQTAQYSAGVVEQDKMLNELQGTTAKTQGTNAEYAAQLANGTMQTAQFAAGQADANKALNELQGNTAHTMGVVSQYAANLASGKEITAEFGAGQADAAMKLVQLRGDTANAAGQFEVYNKAMNDAGEATVQYVAGLTQGRNETAQMVLEMSKAKGEYLGTRDVLVGLANQYGLTGQATQMSNAALTQFVGVMRQSPDAVQALIDKLNEFATNAVSSLSDAMNKGQEDVSKAIDQIQQDLGRALTAPEIQTLHIQADTKNATDKIMADMSLAFQGIKTQSAASVGASIDAAMALAGDRIANSSGTVSAAWQTVMASLQNIKADPLNSPAFIQEAAKIVAALESIGMSGGDVTQFMTGLGLTADQAQKALQAAGVSAGIAGTALGGVGAGAQSSDPMVQAFNATLSGMAPIFGTLDSLASQIFGAMPGYVVNATAGIVGAWSTLPAGMAPILGTIDVLAQQTFEVMLPATVMIGVNTIMAAFNTLPGIVTPVFGLIQSLAQQTFGVLVPQQAVIGVTAVIASFNTLPGAVTPVMGILQSLAQQTFVVFIPQQAIIGVSTVVSTFNTLPGSVAPVMGALQSMAQQTFAFIGASAMQVAVGVNAAYKAAEADANGYLNSMRSTAASIFQAIGTSATAVTTGVNNAYRAAESDANGYLNSMRATAANTFQAIGTSAQQVTTGVNNAFRAAEASATSSLNNIRNTATSVFSAVANAARTAASAVSGIGNSAASAASQVRSLTSSLNSIPNISRTVTITTVYRTVGSPALSSPNNPLTPTPSRAQFGINTILDKTTHIIAGEGFGKERLKISPGTMGFVEDLSKELREKFTGGTSGITSGSLGGLGGLGDRIREWINNFLQHLFDSIGWPFPGHGGGGGGGTGGGGTGGGGGGTGGGGGGGTPIPDRFLKNPSMKNFGFYPVGHPHEGEPILTEHPGQVNNGTLEDVYPNIGTGTNTGGSGDTGTGNTGGGTGGTGGGTGTGTGGGNTNTGSNSGGNGNISQTISQTYSVSQHGPGNNFDYHVNTNTGGNTYPMPGTTGTTPGSNNTQTNTNTTGNINTDSVNSIISQINSISQSSNGVGQNNYYSNINSNTGGNVIPMPTADNPINNVTASVIRQSNSQGNIITSGNSNVTTSGINSTSTQILHETPVPITLEIDGAILTKKIIKLITQELSNAGVYG